MRKTSKSIVLSVGIMFSGVSISLSPLTETSAQAAPIGVSFIKTTYQTTSNVNLRSGASTKFKKIVTIPKGRVVTSGERNGLWYKITYTDTVKGKKMNRTGWVSGNYLKEYDQYIHIAKTYLFTNGKTELYAAPYETSKIVWKVDVQNGFYSLQKVKNRIGQLWYSVNFNGKKYFVKSNKVTIELPKSTSISYYKVNKDIALYSGYGTVYPKIMNLSKGNIVTSNFKLGKWFQVSFNGKKGFLDADVLSLFAQPKEKTLEQKSVYVTSSKLSLYQFADSGSPILATVPEGEEVIPTHLSENGWYKVNYGNKSGYLLGNMLEKKVLSPPPSEIPIGEKPVSQKFVVTVNLNLREKPDVNGAIETVIPQGTIVSPSIQTDNGWFKVFYNGQTGYVSGSYLEKIEDPKDGGQTGEVYTEVKLSGETYLINSYLNVRSLPNIKADILTILPQGEIVQPTHKSSNNWYKVMYDGKTGYVSGEFVERVKTGDPIYTRDSYQFIDLRTQSPVTADQINAYIDNYSKKTGKATVLSNKGQVFIDVGKKYGVNSLYLAAHAIHESGYGTSLISLGKYNLFGFGAYDASPYVAAIRFLDIDSSIDYIAREMKSTYLNPASWKFKGPYLGFSTKTMSGARVDANSEGMNFYYASDVNWGKTIAKHMQNILPYDKTYFDHAQINKTVPFRPTAPEGSDLFPSEIKAVAKKDLILNSKKGANDKVQTIKSGTSFLLMEKTNDYWIRLKIGNQEYWTKDIRLDLYKSYLSVKNLGRNTASSLNIRSGPDTSFSVIGNYKLNDYVEIVLNSNGEMIMNNDKTWYQVKLDSGAKGWVSTRFISLELQ